MERQEVALKLRDAISQLSSANVGFQQYVGLIEEKTSSEERKRIGREIHDTIGYTLTNIRMMLEAAGDMMERDIHGSRSLMEKAAVLAKEGITESRKSCRSSAPTKGAT